MQISAKKYLSRWSWRDVSAAFPVEGQTRNPNLHYSNIQLSFFGTLCAIWLLFIGEISFTIKNLVARTWQWGSLHLAYKNFFYISAKINDLSLFLLRQLWGYQALSIMKRFGKSEWDQQSLRGVWKTPQTRQSECRLRRWDILRYARDSLMESGHGQKARLTSLGDN